MARDDDALPTAAAPGGPSSGAVVTPGPDPAVPSTAGGYSAGYGEYPATVGALPPLGWTLPTPPEGIPVVVVPKPLAPPMGGGVRSPEQDAAQERKGGGQGLLILISVLVACLVLGAGAVLLVLR